VTSTVTAGGIWASGSQCIYDKACDLKLKDNLSFITMRAHPLNASLSYFLPVTRPSLCFHQFRTFLHLPSLFTFTLNHKQKFATANARKYLGAPHSSYNPSITPPTQPLLLTFPYISLSRIPLHTHLHSKPTLPVLRHHQRWPASMKSSTWLLQCTLPVASLLTPTMNSTLSR
jgi:hypothetical protein